MLQLLSEHGEYISRVLYIGFLEDLEEFQSSFERRDLVQVSTLLIPVPPDLYVLDHRRVGFDVDEGLLEVDGVHTESQLPFADVDHEQEFISQVISLVIHCLF